MTRGGGKGLYWRHKIQVLPLLRSKSNPGKRLLLRKIGVKKKKNMWRKITSHRDIPLGRFLMHSYPVTKINTDANTGVQSESTLKNSPSSSLSPGCVVWLSSLSPHTHKCSLADAGACSSRFRLRTLMIWGAVRLQTCWSSQGELLTAKPSGLSLAVSFSLSGSQPSLQKHCALFTYAASQVPQTAKPLQ